MRGSMIDINSWPLKVQLAFTVTPLIFMMMGVAISAYVAWSHEFEIVKSSIRSSPYLEQMKNFLGATSYRARWIVVCLAGGLLSFPRYHARRRLVSLEELKAFPKALKRKLVLSTWLVIVGFSWMMVGYALIQFAKTK